MALSFTKLSAAAFLTAGFFTTINAHAFSDPAKQLSFKENLGQVSDQYYRPRRDVLFYGTDGQLSYHIRNTGISYQLTKVISLDSGLGQDNFYAGKAQDRKVSQFSIYRLDINWLNANEHAVIQKEKVLPGYDNYYRASCPKGALNVKSYSAITYRQIYKGIDLTWYEKDGQLKYDYTVSAGADHRLIQLEFDGAESLSVSTTGELVIKTSQGEIVENAPLVKQGNKILPSAWRIKNNVVGFDIKGIDHALPFTIDPLVRVWGTYYGGTGYDESFSCAVDKQKNVFISGDATATSWNEIATVGAHQIVCNGFFDAFVAKFDSMGVRQWGTFYGGTDYDGFSSSSVDKYGNVYSVGYSGSDSVIASAGAYQVLRGGSKDAMLVKLDVNGVRKWATYFGGSGEDFGMGCATDENGNIYITGAVGAGSTSGISTAGAHQTTHGGGYYNGFLAKFDSLGTRLWATYYGGSTSDRGEACVVDTIHQCVYMSGNTESTNSLAIATAGSHQSVKGGSLDVFLVKFNTNGVRQWGTYYGGTDMEIQNGACTVDNTGNVFLTGSTMSSNPGAISTAGSHQSMLNDGFDAFLVKFNANGVRQWGTYYGGDYSDYGRAVCTDYSGNIYMAGQTGSPFSNMASTDAYQYYINGSKDALLVKFNTNGVRQWATYFGGNLDEAGYGCAVYGNDVYLSGTTNSNNPSVLASAGAHQTVYNGSSEAFLQKFNDQLATAVSQFEDPENAILTVFPNPSNAAMTIKAKETFDLNIINELGQVVRNIRLEQANDYELTIDDLDAGIYSVHGTSKKNVVSTKIIVVK